MSRASKRPRKPQPTKEQLKDDRQWLLEQIHWVVKQNLGCGFMPTCAEHDTHNSECERCKRALIAADEGDW